MCRVSAFQNSSLSFSPSASCTPSLSRNLLRYKWRLAFFPLNAHVSLHSFLSCLLVRFAAFSCMSWETRWAALPLSLGNISHARLFASMILPHIIVFRWWLGRFLFLLPYSECTYGWQFCWNMLIFFLLLLLLKNVRFSLFGGIVLEAYCVRLAASFSCYFSLS